MDNRTVQFDTHDEATSPAPTPSFQPASQLRRAFFNDLDASSRVNPNRVRRSGTGPTFSDADMNTVRTIVLGVLREDSPASAEPEYSLDGDGRPTMDPEVFRQQHQQLQPQVPVPRPRYNFGPDDDREDVAVDASGPHGGLPASPRAQVRATSAVLTNIVAGSLAGVALRRVSYAALGNIGAGVAVTQALCFLGYAQVEWRALIADTLSLIYAGAPPLPEEQTTNRLRVFGSKLAVILTATIPRRLSFWFGVAGGLLLL